MRRLLLFRLLNPFLAAEAGMIALVVETGHQFLQIVPLALIGSKSALPTTSLHQ